MKRLLLPICIVLAFGGRVRPAPYMHDPLQPVRRGTGYATKFAFDFGKANSTVRPGFKAVTADTVLGDASEFGWRNAKGVRDYFVQDDYKRSDFPVTIFYRPYEELALNDLNEDALWGKTPAEFHVRLPAGEYGVYYMGGVPLRGGFPGPDYFKFRLRLNDRVDDTVCIPMSNVFENRRYRVTVDQEGLTIGLTPITTWIVNGLVIYPADERKNVEECILAPLEEDVYLLPPYAAEKGLRSVEKVADAAPRPDFQPTTEQRSRGYVVYASDWIERVHPTAPPDKKSIGAPVDVFATPGEWEAACFVVRPIDSSCRKVNVVIAPPVTLKGRAIEKENIRLYRVQYAWLSEGTGRGYGPGRTLRARLAPHYLVPDTKTDVPAGRNQPYWLNIRVPEEAAPGIYEGAIRIQPEGCPATEVPLRIRVLPFVLKTRPDFVYGVYWSAIWNYHKLRNRDETVREEARRREEANLLDFREHMVQCFPYGRYGRWKIDVENKKVEPVDPTFPGMAEAAELWRRAGCTGPIISTPVKILFWQLERSLVRAERPKTLRYRQQWHRQDAELPPLVFELLTQGARIVQEHVKKMGYPEFLYYILDESDPKLMRKLYSAVKKAPGARTYTTSGNYPEDIGSWIDVNCSTGSFLSRGDWKGEIRERAERGEFEPWAYPNGAIMGYNGAPNRCRYIYGFYAWKMGLRGLCPWIYTTNNSKGNPFNDFDRDYPDTGFVMPGPDGLILTTRWDGAREGIDDMRYVYTLSCLIEKAKRSAVPQARSAAAEAEQALAELKTDVPEQYYGPVPDRWTEHNAHAYRWYVATLIMKLQEALAAKD